MTNKTFTVVSEHYEDGERVFVLREKQDDDLTLGYVRDQLRYTEGPRFPTGELNRRLKELEGSVVALKAAFLGALEAGSVLTAKDVVSLVEERLHIQ